MGRRSQDPLTLVPGSAPTLADPPPTLREAGATLWRSIMAEYAITDSGGRAILEQACASADRAAECAAIIAEQGAVISTKHGLKDHPCCDTRRLPVALLADCLQGWGSTSSCCDRPLAGLEPASDGCRHDEHQAEAHQPPTRVTDYAAGDPPVH
jgi:hypothetical protein